MSKQHKSDRTLTGEFLGWSDDCIPHRDLKLATDTGTIALKVAKSLRSQIQDWQVGISLSLTIQERRDPATGKVKTKVKQYTAVDRLPTTQIQVCQGSSCRRRGSAEIGAAMQAYIDRYQLTDRVEIQPVKCLHQCKNAPCALFIGSAESEIPGKIAYNKLQPYQITAILTKHLPIAIATTPLVTNLITQVSDYFQQPKSNATYSQPQPCKI